MLRLEHLSWPHAAELQNLHLPEEQRVFTAHPSALLPTLTGDSWRVPVVITQDGRAVGLFVLAVGPHRDRYLPAPDLYGVALTALSVDACHQGRGIATGALRLLPTFVREVFPGARHVLLAVNQRNDRARRVYERVGFTVRGERQGSHGPQWLMTLLLTPPADWLPTS